MQDRTIDNALLALRKVGGEQGAIADTLLALRGVALPARSYRHQQFRRGECARLMLDALRGGPQTVVQLGEVVRSERPTITCRAANNRAYQALLRLEARGLSVQDFGPDGCLWALAQ
jgi:hypothetical protein